MGTCIQATNTYGIKSSASAPGPIIKQTSVIEKPIIKPEIQLGREYAATVTGRPLDIKFYHYIGSQPSRSMLTLLDEANVKYESIALNMLAGEHKSPEFLKINPKGNVPTLIINGKVYLESAATLRLLTQVLPTLRNRELYPKNAKKRHAIDAALDFNGTTFRPKLAKRNDAFFAQLSAGKIVTPEVQTMIDRGNEEVRSACELLERMLDSTPGDYLTGDEMTIADIQIFHQSNDVMWHGNSWKDFPSCYIWRSLMYELPSIKKYQERWQTEFWPLMNTTIIPDESNIELPQNHRILINEIIDFWWPPFENNRHFFVGEETMSLHFSSKNDKLIREKFLTAFSNLEKGQYEGWRNDNDGRLAYILIADQFGRAMFRGTSKAFSLDEKAYEVAKSIIDDESQWDKYRHHEWLFILTPLMHKENISSVDQAELQCKIAINKCDYEGNLIFAELFKTVLKFVASHKEAIEAYGRYPSRNKALGRENTQQETEYLKSAATWGQ